MIAKFVGLSLKNSMEVEKNADGISFSINKNGLDVLENTIIVPSTEIPNLIKFLTDIQTSMNLNSAIH